MSEKILFDAINNIKDEYIAEAELHRVTNFTGWKKVLASAAGLVMLIGIGVGLVWNLTSPKRDTDLPMLTLDLEQDTEAFGQEGYFVKSIDDLVNANPWNEDSRIETLPVYEGEGDFENANVDNMKDTLKMIAKRFGVSFDDNEITYNGVVRQGEEKEIITYVMAAKDGLQFTVDPLNTVTITYEKARKIPVEYKYTEDATYDEVYLTAKYLLKEYAGIISMKDPEINVNGGDCNIYGDSSYEISFYEGDGTLESQIINYNYNQVSFHADESGDISIIHINVPDLSKKVGEYPVTSIREAEKLLKYNHYITSSSLEFPGMNYVKKVELVYRTGFYAVQVPFYKFYVELPEEAFNDMTVCGPYYVPAVEEQYIKNMPIWDGETVLNTKER